MATRKVTNTETGCQEVELLLWWTWLCGPQAFANGLGGGMWKSLEMWGRQVLESSMGHLGRSLDHNADRNTDSKADAHEGSDRNNDSIRLK